MESYDEMIRERRMLLKSLDIWYDEWESYQRKGVPPPPLEKPYPKDGILFDMVKINDLYLRKISMLKVIKQRQSRRKYTSKALTLQELSFLLWATQGIKSIDTNKVWTKRTVPSGGARILLKLI